MGNHPNDLPLDVPASPLRGFRQFIKQTQALSAVLSVVAAGSPLPFLVKGLGPPWPDTYTITVITVLIAMCVYLFTYQFYRMQFKTGRGKQFLERRLFFGIIGLVVSLMAYVAIF